MSLRINGGTINLPGSTVKNEQVATDAEIDADKLQHYFKQGTRFGLAIGDTPVAKEEIIYTVTNAAGAKVRTFNALLNVTGTATNIDFDLKVNGSTILSGVINITDATTDRQTQSATLSTPNLSSGDVLSISMAVTTSTGAEGPFAWAEIEEFAA